MTYASKRKTRPLLILHYLLMLLLMFVSLFYLPWEIFSLWSINVALFAVGFWTLDRVMRKLLNML
ncbi:MAG: hypothetical protein LBP53_02025 [Candidatus Peribacteria bacterium]|nr:hypothetical protein [Candidatus Peribacteria bacterium]